MKTKNVEIVASIEGAEVPVVVTIRRLTWGEINRLADESTSFKMQGSREPTATVSQTALRENGLLKSMVKIVRKDNNAELPVSIAFLTNLDFEQGNLLFEEYETLNSIDIKKND
jgi:hypothetical protein